MSASDKPLSKDVELIETVGRWLGEKSEILSDKVGGFLRATNLDEVPQFLHVLSGDMAVVGPRPSPFEENQYCPSWQETRLSVRPGITGLWQVKRTREEGLDFQEWIRYDVEYVEKLSWRLDLWILWQTVGVVFGGFFRAFRRVLQRVFRRG